jgi:hypothetical protein
LYFGNFGYEQTLPGILPPFGKVVNEDETKGIGEIIYIGIG